MKQHKIFLFFKRIVLFLFSVLKVVNMQKITLKDKTFRPFITYDKIAASIDKVAEQINKDFEGCTDVPVLLCVLNGSIRFMAELMQRLDFNCQIISIKLTSYEGTETTGKVKQAMGLTADITGRRVIVVEDIVDSGRTLSYLLEMLQDRHPASLHLCTLLDKPERRKAKVFADYAGAQIPDAFVVGYGLDYDEKYRNLPFVGALKPAVYEK